MTTNDVAIPVGEYPALPSMTPTQVAAALATRCGLCNAKPGEPCLNPCGGELRGRQVHWYRIPTS